VNFTMNSAPAHCAPVGRAPDCVPLWVGATATHSSAHHASHRVVAAAAPCSLCAGGCRLLVFPSHVFQQELHCFIHQRPACGDPPGSCWAAGPPINTPRARVQRAPARPAAPHPPATPAPPP
jgi:hypothetical protein